MYTGSGTGTRSWLLAFNPEDERRPNPPVFRILQTEELLWDRSNGLQSGLPYRAECQKLGRRCGRGPGISVS